MASTANGDPSLEEVYAEGDLHSAINCVSVGFWRGTETEDQASCWTVASHQHRAFAQEPPEDQEEQNQIPSPRQSSQHSVSIGNDKPPQPLQSRGRFDAVLCTKWDLLIIVTATALFAVTVWFAQAAFSASSMELVR